MPIRVYVAGSWGSMVSQAAHLALWRNANVELVGFELGRVRKDRLREANADVLISAAHRYHLDGEMRGLARIGSVGLHPSLLPRYRGSWPLWWALRNREEQVGMTMFVLDDGTDTGPILAQATEATRPGDTFPGLYERVAPLAIPMLEWLVREIVASGGLPAGITQDEAGATTFRAPTLLQRAEGRLADRILSVRTHRRAKTR